MLVVYLPTVYNKEEHQVRSGPSLGAVGYSCSPAGEGPPPHFGLVGGGWGQSRVL